MRRRWFWPTMVMLSIALVPSLSAAETSAADRAAARALFDQARELVAKGNFAEACTKLEESQRLDAGMGTMFNLADCYEKVGKTASAWTLFLDVAAQAKNAGQAEKESVARDRAKAIEPKLSRLTIKVPSAVAFDGLQVLRDGSPIGTAMWNTALPVDPGEHNVEVKGPKKKPWSTTVKVGASATESIEVPPLEDAPQASDLNQDAAAEAGGDKPGSGRRTVGIVVAGVGVVGLGVSGILGWTAKGKIDDAAAWCSGDVCTDMRGVDLRNEARSRANVATIVGAIGGAALVGGAVLYFTAPRSSPEKSARAPLSLALSPTSVSLQGAW